MSEAEPFDLRIICAPGLETMLRDEVQAILAVRSGPPAPGPPVARREGGRNEGWRVDVGGLELPVDAAGLRDVVLHSRIAESWRVLALRGRAAGPVELERQLRRVAWASWLPPERPLRIDASCRKSRIYHSGLAIDRTEKAITRALGPRTFVREIDTDPVHIWLRIEHDELELRLEAGPPRGHRRGWRSHVGAAPLRETLAAALLRAAGICGAGLPKLKPGAVLADPFCGSGTLLLEALDADRGQAPQRVGALGIDVLPALEAASSRGARRSAASGETDVAPTAAQAMGSDRDAAAIAAAQHNAVAAGLAERCRWRTQDVAAAVAALPPGSVVVSNLPYGLRTDDDAVRSLRAFAAALRKRSDLGPAFVLDGGLAASAGIQGQQVLHLRHGGLAVRWLRLNR